MLASLMIMFRRRFSLPHLSLLPASQTNFCQVPAHHCHSPSLPMIINHCLFTLPRSQPPVYSAEPQTMARMYTGLTWYDALSNRLFHAHSQIAALHHPFAYPRGNNEQLFMFVFGHLTTLPNHNKCNEKNWKLSSLQVPDRVVSGVLH